MQYCLFDRVNKIDISYPSSKNIIQTINYVAHFLLSQSPGSEIVDAISKTTLCHLIKCTHEILKLKSYMNGEHYDYYNSIFDCGFVFN